MGYERYPRGTNPQGDYYNRDETQDYGRDYGSGRYGSYSSARDYQAAGEFGQDRDERGYGSRSQGRGDYGRDRSDYGSHERSASREYGARDYGHGGYAQRDRAGARGDDWRNDHGRGDTYASSRSYGGNRDQRSDYGRPDMYRTRGQQQGYGRQPQGYDYEDRGFFARAGDEVRSWFGDDEAERRRDADARNDERYYRSGESYGRDDDYGTWRRGQIDALDRDYDEYRRENQSKWASEFGSWRTNRQTQRTSLSQVKEHQDVVGSDGGHVGTVDKVRGDRIILTKSDQDAGGHHHSIPSSWLKSVDDKVTITKTANEAHSHWRDEEQNTALFGEDRGRLGNRDRSDRDDDQGRTNLNRSFSGTY